MSATAERAWWDTQAVADPFAAAWGGTDHRARVLREGVEAILSAMPTAGRLLDLGCGPGRFALAVADRLPRVEVVGVDSSLAMLAAARAEAAAHPRLSFVECDGRRLPDVGLLDGAWTVAVLQHVPASAAAGYVEQMAVALRRGACLRLQVVVGERRAFVDHQCAEGDPVDWCEDAGLTVEAVDRGLVYPEWLWVTARKPT